MDWVYTFFLWHKGFVCICGRKSSIVMNLWEKLLEGKRAYKLCVYTKYRQSSILWTFVKYAVELNEEKSKLQHVSYLHRFTSISAKRRTDNRCNSTQTIYILKMYNTWHVGIFYTAHTYAAHVIYDHIVSDISSITEHESIFLCHTHICCSYRVCQCTDYILKHSTMSVH